LLLAGGGTGGHVFPGLALYEVLRREGYVMLFLTDPRAREFLRGQGVDFKVIHVRALSRYRLAELPLTLVCFLYGLVETLFRMLAFKPHLVVGIGGFVSFPPLLVARFLSLRTALLEQNSLPGLATRLMAPYVDKVFLSYPESARFFRGHVRSEVTGNPVRPSVLRPGRKECRGELGIDPGDPVVVVLGGSQGAHRINQAVAEWFESRANDLGIKFLVLCGSRDEEMMKRAAEGFEPPPLVWAFRSDIGRVLAAADLVVSRAGATAVAEITARGLPAVFVPYPFAANDHQRLNVENLRRLGAALVIDDGELTGGKLRRTVESLLRDRERLEEMGRKCLELSRPDAASRVSAAIGKMIGDLPS